MTLPTLLWISLNNYTHHINESTCMMHTGALFLCILPYLSFSFSTWLAIKRRSPPHVKQVLQ